MKSTGSCGARARSTPSGCNICIKVIRETDRATLKLHFGDLTDASGLMTLVQSIEPDEIYNLAAQSHVRVSFDQPLFTADVNALGTLRILEAARSMQNRHPARVYQASSSEMFGKVSESPQRETTPFHPRSPYACARVFGFFQTVNYREAYGLHASNGILFNHESPLRGEMFVTRKITRAAARIRQGLQQNLHLGNLDARRDWGYAKDYVEAMWLMLQQDVADDYIIATGETHSIRELLDLAFRHVGLHWKDHVIADPQYLRPTDVDMLVGDASKARAQLGWRPRTSFVELVQLMMEHDWELARHERQGHTRLAA